MRIAQVAPLWERVAPPSYGDTGLVVSRLTDELVRQGHDITLFASGDSQTLARLEAIYPCAMRFAPRVKEYAAYEMLELSQVYKLAAEFDIIHSHIGIASGAIAPLINTPTIHTLHADFTPDNSKLFTLHAIAIAKQTGRQLKMVGKINLVDTQFFEQEITPQIDGKQIQYLGKFNHTQKAELLGNTAVTLFTITWHEPFGLVMIESMATGTPVIGMDLGAVPEVIAERKTGFVCQSYVEMAHKIPAALELDHLMCRTHLENNFSVTQMVDGYEAADRKLLEDRIISNEHLHTSEVAF